MKDHVKKLTTASVFAAVIFLAVWLIRIPLPNGFAHAGDAIVFSLMLFLPLGYGCAAAAIGAVIADIASGYAIYAPFTFIIKPLCLIVFALFKKNKSHIVRYAVPALIAAVLNAALYFAADGILYGVPGALASLPGNLTQGAVSVILFFVINIVSNKYNTDKGAKK